MQQSKSGKHFLSQYFIIVIFAIVFIMFAVVNPNFVSGPNISVILKQTAILGIASFGMMFVIISSGRI